MKLIDYVYDKDLEKVTVWLEEVSPEQLDDILSVLLGESVYETKETSLPKV